MIDTIIINYLTFLITLLSFSLMVSHLWSQDMMNRLQQQHEGVSGKDEMIPLKFLEKTKLNCLHFMERES